MARTLITGGTGLLGRALGKALVAHGHEVRMLGRRAGAVDGIPVLVWDPSRRTMDPRALEGVERIVHLAGAGIADKRWSGSRVRELIASRADSAEFLLERSRTMDVRPKVIVSSAGIDRYGASTSDAILTEDDPPGDDTIGRICQAWESAVDRWEGTCRTVKLRLPIVLAREGGALPRMATPVHWGLGAPLGTGRQWVNWVHIEDAVRAFMHALDDGSMSGAYHVTSSDPVRNRDFMRELARVLRKPFFLPAVPGFALRLVLGKMATVLLNGTRASHTKLLAMGFQLKHPTLREALGDLLGSHVRNA